MDKLTNVGPVEAKCGTCGRSVHADWVACPHCGVAVRERPALPSTEVDQLKRKMELRNICSMAIRMNEEAMLGTPRELRSKFPEEYAPFKPENLGLWKEAAELGLADGQYLFGRCLIEAGEKDAGKHLLEEAASQGHVQARRELGELLLERGEQQKGLALLSQAVESGDAVACEALASYYEEGIHLQKSRWNSRKWRKRGAELGNYHSQSMLEADRLI